MIKKCELFLQPSPSFTDRNKFNKIENGAYFWCKWITNVMGLKTIYTLSNSNNAMNYYR